MHTIQLRKDELIAFESLFADYGAIKLNKTNQYEHSRFRVDDNTIIIYTSGKVVFSEYPSKNIEKAIISFFESKDSDKFFTIGCDEAGKGEVLGPVVVSAVLLKDKRERARARMYGAMDSKELSTTQIDDVYMRSSGFISSVRMLSPHDFNKLFSDNLNFLLCDLYISALTELLKKVKGKGTIYIDKFGGREHDVYLKQQILKIRPDVNVEISIKAERYPAVACASIISKYEYEKWLKSNLHDIHIQDLSELKSLDNDTLIRIAKLKYIK